MLSPDFRSLLRALPLLALGCSASTHPAPASPSPAAPTPVVEPAPVHPAETADAAAATTEDAAAPVAEAHDAGPPMAELPPMPANLHGPAHPWAQMSAQEKGHYMDQAVLPVMRDLLHAYNPSHFANVTCATCHGATARAVHFHMPNSLPVLPAFGSQEGRDWMARDPRMFQFMATRIVPVMATLLGVEPFNMQTHQGFGCAGCHAHEAADAGAPGAAHPAHPAHPAATH